MNFDFSSCDTLFEVAHQEELYPDLVAQLRKDFALANVALDFEVSISASRLQELLREKIYHLIMERFDEYLHLLYIIDVPERTFKDLRMTDVVEVADQMTLFVLQRELQKVWFKRRYTP